VINVTKEQKAAIAETKSALDCLESLLVVMRELNQPLTQERIAALGLAMSLEMMRINDAQPFLPSSGVQEAA
jgi:hypothetical protein